VILSINSWIYIRVVFLQVIYQRVIHRVVVELSQQLQAITHVGQHFLGDDSVVEVLRPQELPKVDLIIRIFFFLRVSVVGVTSVQFHVSNTPLSLQQKNVRPAEDCLVPEGL
jgi:hypothetical protein